MTTGRACAECGARLRKENASSLCDPCETPYEPCRVCNGRGKAGQGYRETCYRCGGTGARPRSQLDARRRK